MKRSCKVLMVMARDWYLESLERSGLLPEITMAYKREHNDELTSLVFEQRPSGYHMSFTNKETGKTFRMHAKTERGVRNWFESCVLRYDNK